MRRLNDQDRPRGLVEDVMLRNPKTLAATASLTQAREMLAGDHVHMVLLTEGAYLVGTLVRGDIPVAARGDSPARSWSRLVGRTVPANTSSREIQHLMNKLGIRRLAVVDPLGRLSGLLCLKQRRTGFCSDFDVASRSGDSRLQDGSVRSSV